MIVSPCVGTIEALAPFRIAQPIRMDGDPILLSYLWDADDQAHGAVALTLELFILPASDAKAPWPAERNGRGAVRR